MKKRDDSNEPELRERLLGDCIDRLNRGESVDLDRLIREHPELGEEFVEQVEAFRGIGKREDAVPLGKLGDYRLLRRIGRGGMGVVYEAMQESMDRRVALKVLPGGLLADLKAVARFEREARIAGKLQHPSIVSVHGSGVDRNTPFYAMEFVEGETLSQILKRSIASGGKGAEEARESLLATLSPLLLPGVRTSSGKNGSSWGRGIAETAADQKGAGEEEGAVGEAPGESSAAAPPLPRSPLQADSVDLVYCARLAEAFAGVAEGLEHAHRRGVIHRDIKPSNLILNREGQLRILDFGLARLEGDASLTMSGDFLGTPLYMSPEQAMAKRIPVTHRTDLYSLGATLYEMLSLRPPFQGKDHQDTLSQIIFHDPEPLRRSNPRIPRDLETIVLKCLRKDPEERYGTAEALSQDLRRFARGDPIEARPQSTWERLARRAARHRWRIAGAALLFALAAAAGWLGLLQLGEHRKSLEAAYRKKVLDAVLRLELASFSQRTEGGEASLGASGALRRAGGPKALDPVAAALAELEDAEKLLPGRPDAAYHRARALRFQGKDAEAGAALEPLAAGAHPFLPAVAMKADLLEKRGEMEKARSIVEAAGKEAKESWEKAWASIWKGWRSGGFQEVIEAYTVLIESSNGPREPYVGCALLSRVARGNARLQKNDPADALEDFTVAQSLVPEAVEPAILAGKAWSLLERKDLAGRLYERAYGKATAPDEVAYALAWLQAELKDEEGALAWAAKVSAPSVRETVRGDLFQHFGRRDEAVEAGEKAIALDPRSADPYLSLASNLMQNEKHDRAWEILLKALEIDPEDPSAVFSAGFCAFKRREHRDAIRYCEKCIRHEPNHAYAYTVLGLSNVFLGDAERGKQCFQKAEELAPMDGGISNNKAVWLLAEGLIDEAARAFERATELSPLDSNPWHQKGHLFFYQGRLDDALTTLLEASTRLPWSPRTWNYLGRIHALRGDLVKSLDAFLAILERDPEYPEAHQRIARLLRENRGKWPAENVAPSTEKLEAALKRSPKSARIRNSLALLLIAPAAPAQARRALDLVLEGLEEASANRVLENPLGPTLVDVLQALPQKSTEPATLLDLLPSLPTYAGIDALLTAAEGGPKLEGARKWNVSRDAGGKARERFQYLEGSLRLRSGKSKEAAEELDALVKLDSEHSEPTLRLAESLLASGEPARAEVVLRAALEAVADRDRRLWDLWLLAGFDGLKLNAERILRTFPREAPRRTEASPAKDADQLQEDYRASVLWLLEKLRDGAPVRIDCGSDCDRDAKGRTWGKDRFFLGGRIENARFTVDVKGTDDPKLYFRARSFPHDGTEVLPGYLFPLPAGRYQVRLHFAEMSSKVRGERGSGIVIQGREVAREFDPLEKGFATAVVLEFPAEVKEGLLEVRFTRPPVKMPVVLNAIEIAKPE